MTPVFDSNILIDHLQHRPAAWPEIKRYAFGCVSVISWIEVMAGIKNPVEEAAARDLLSLFEIIEIDEPIREQAVIIRRSHRLKLPDAIIWATAQARNTLLVTRNSQDFPTDHPSIRIPYSTQPE
jgi:predicted nucleic acid-binding protein